MFLITPLIKKLKRSFNMRKFRKDYALYFQADRTQDELREVAAKKAQAEGRLFGPAPSMNGMILFFSMQSNPEYAKEVRAIANKYGVYVSDLPESLRTEILKKHLKTPDAKNTA